MSIALRRKRKLGDAFPVGTLMFCLLKQLWDNVAQESLRWRRNQVKSCKWTSLHWSSLHFHHHHHNMHYCTCQRLLLKYWQCHCTANVAVSLDFEVHHSTHNAHIIVSVHKVFFCITTVVPFATFSGQYQDDQCDNDSNNDDDYDVSASPSKP